MKIRLEESDGYTIVHILENRVDAANSALLKSSLTGLFSEGARKVIVDLGQVAFLDSSGLGALISALKHAAISESVLKLAGPQPPVRQLLELTRLSQVFDLYPNVALAKASVAAGSQERPYVA